MHKKTIVIFQQDLRLSDNPALSHAAKRGEVIAIYVWDNAAGSERLGSASKSGKENKSVPYSKSQTQKAPIQKKP